MNKIIETKGLSKTFNGVQALKPLDLTVEKNVIYGFLGPNGAGKTTVMKLLLGLIKPSEGSGSIFGMDIIKRGIDIRQKIGYLPQNFDIGYYGHLSAREILRFTAKFYFKGPNKTIERRINEMLDLVDLSDKADRPIEGFSGGEKQRLGIAQAQINYPDLLILDEPVAALDPLGRHTVLKVMERLRKFTTIFYSTHILDDVQRVSDYVAILNKGELLTQGPIDEILEGTNSTQYQVKLKGKNLSILREKLFQESWINNIKVKEQNGSTTWLISVNDSEAAETELFQKIQTGEKIRVLEYSQKNDDLEDIFLKLVEA
ncbi:MAG: ABC transporter ATP-binding protein [Candidatus Kariarchaeaceae archaeon]|jgi:ABC-2 type transport system ATP-binding protein